MKKQVCLNLETLQWFEAQADELTQDLARICCRVEAPGHDPAELPTIAELTGERLSLSSR